MTLMTVSVRSYLATGVSLTAASAIAFAPLVTTANGHPATIPNVTATDIELTVSPSDIEAFVADLRAVFDEATITMTELAGAPGRTLIGVVNNIVTLINTVFTGLNDATGNQTIRALLTVLQTFSADAFAMLAENLGRINPVITTTTAHVGELLTSAVTGSLQNILIAVVRVSNDPLSVANYAGLLTAGVAGSQLVARNGLEAIQGVGDAVFDIAGIALDEVTFQFNNFALNGIGALLAELGDASGNAVVEAVLGAVHRLAIVPAVAVFNVGSGAIDTVLTAANTGFDLILDGAISLVDAPVDAAPSTIVHAGPQLAGAVDDSPQPAGDAKVTTPDLHGDPAVPAVDSAAIADVEPIPPMISAEEPVVEDSVVENVQGEESVEAAEDEARTENDATAEEAAEMGDENSDEGAVPDSQSDDAQSDDGTDNGDDLVRGEESLSHKGSDAHTDLG
jgi:hypothetical protein